MLNASSEFKQLIKYNQDILFKATLTLAEGTVIQLTGDDFMEGSTSFTEATSSSNGFDIGAAVIGKFSCTLNNYSRKFEGMPFKDAIIEPYIGLELSDGAKEWVKKGVYHVEDPNTMASTIHLDCYDNLTLLEVDYVNVTTIYPASLRTIVNDICQYAGIMLGNATFFNETFVVKERPQEEMTCLSMLSYVAQVAGCYAKVDSFGRLYLQWYDVNAADGMREAKLDGGSFYDDTGYIKEPKYESGNSIEGGSFGALNEAGTAYGDGDNADAGDFVSYASGATASGGEFDYTEEPAYVDGDIADGGDFENYVTGWVLDGGSFLAYGGAAEDITAISSMTLGTDEIKITGVAVKVEAPNANSDEEQLPDDTALCGEEGYVLSIEGNPLIGYGQAAEVAQHVGAVVIDMTFRSYDAQIIGTPLYEAGDPVVLISPTGIRFFSYITNQSYSLRNYMSISNTAETPARQSATTHSAATKAYLKAKEEVRKERSAREVAFAEMTKRLAESSGMYISNDVQEDGSSIYYMHDKKTLEDSTIVWKLTAEVLGMSTDGGKTYPYMLSVEGDTILRRIYAIGLDATYIRTGVLSVQSPTTSETLFKADIDTGEVSITSDSVVMASTNVNSGGTSEKATLTQYADKLSSTVSSISSAYAICSTSANVQTKTVSADTFTATNGESVFVKFVNANTASSPILRVNDTSAVIRQENGSAITSAQYWKAGDIRKFTYRNNMWYMGADDVTPVAGLVDRVSSVEQTAASITSTVTAMQSTYGTCTTASATQTKLVTAANFRLFKGAEITVKFSYENTASNPMLNVNSTGAKYILINNSYMTSAYYWKNNGVMSFRYDGTYWVVADSSTMSMIKQTADSITSTVSAMQSTQNGLANRISTVEQKANSISLSVTDGAIGKSASIKLSVGGSQVASGTIDMKGVRNAFKNDTTAIAISAGTVTFNSNTFVVNSTNFGVTSNGTMTAKNATISGTITATAGSIGGLAISSNSIKSSNNNFSVTSAGALTAKNATISGSITATSGKIGAYTIGSSYLYCGSRTSHTNNNSGALLNASGVSFGSGSSRVYLNSDSIKGYGGGASSSIEFQNFGSGAGMRIYSNYDLCISARAVYVTSGYSQPGPSDQAYTGVFTAGGVRFTYRNGLLLVV